MGCGQSQAYIRRTCLLSLHPEHIDSAGEGRHVVLLVLQGVVHITGGGLPENMPRVIPNNKDLGFHIDLSSWTVPPLFQWLQEVRVFFYPTCLFVQRKLST